MNHVNYLLLSFEHILENLGDFRDHWHEECVIGLIHKTFIILDLVIELLLNIVLHLMGNEATGDFVSDLTQ